MRPVVGWIPQINSQLKLRDALFWMVWAARVWATQKEGQPFEQGSHYAAACNCACVINRLPGYIGGSTT
eukprot:215231-Pelagomonas_calceolata.AAC.4